MFYDKIEKLEKENKNLKGNFLSMENQNPHEETMDIVENVQIFKNHIYTHFTNVKHVVNYLQMNEL